MPCVPSIVVERNPLIEQSSSSLEIADIYHGLLNVGMKPVDPMHTLNVVNAQLRIPSPSSSSSVSPIPLSPVTVIDAEELDTKHDVIDVDGTDPEKTTKEVAPVEDEFPEPESHKEAKSVADANQPNLLEEHLAKLPNSSADVAETWRCDESAYESSTDENDLDMPSVPHSESKKFVSEMGIQSERDNLSPIYPFVIGYDSVSYTHLTLPTKA